MTPDRLGIVADEDHPGLVASVATGTGLLPDERAQLFEEANALALFIARRGTLLANDPDRENAYRALRDAVASAQAGNESSDNALLDAYANVTAFTYADFRINGRTILDTEDQGQFLRDRVSASQDHNGFGARFGRKIMLPRCRPLLLGLSLFALVLVFEALLLAADQLELAELHTALEAIKTGLLPLVWGAIGTCAFLMKRINDKLSAFAYEEARARGMGTRVFLGAVMGLMVVEMIGAGGETPLGQFPLYLIAFLSGLGIKPVYAAIEGLVEGIAARIKLPPDRRGKS